MTSRAQVKGEVITITVTLEPPIVLIASGAQWGTGPGQSLDIDFILDQSTLG